ncbi:MULTISPECIES: GNAT family N-acetyltransferase [Pseudomonas]|uniref:GNAT family N-acetyltransferase n=1 Tax=Pseudomonas TaxID=286 RepID=UPI001E43DEEC|nr:MULTISPECIES: GNAT family N-acetyltransferase [Pseudomonas]MCE1118840.1 GNAT family N-acetyltransferase [Pseudomonas sp. NMI795_08]
MPDQAFDYQPVLQGVSLRLESLTRLHFEAMLLAASDPLIWAGHPSADRYKPEVFEPYLETLLATGKALAVIDVRQGTVIGGSSYYTPPDQLDGIAIGFTFLVRAHWGGASNRELKGLMLEHAFKRHDRVFFHIAPTNIRSQKATLKLGAEHLYDAQLNLSGASRLWKCYALTRARWAHR